jgi:type IV pilus assembly protein PilB
VKSYTIKSDGDLKRLLRVQKQMPDMHLGEALIEEGVITKDQLETALEAQRQFKTSPHHLGQILVESGLVTPEQLTVALAHKLAIPFISIAEFKIDPHAITLVPPEIAQHYKVLPLASMGGTLVVAMINPFDEAAIDALRFNSKMNIDVVMASAEEIGDALSKHYSSYEEIEALEDLKLDPIAEPSANEEALHTVEAEAKKKPIVRLLNSIVLQAVNSKASDINIRPEKDRVNVYFRIDGKMQFIRGLSRSLLPALVSRVKITGQMDISERRLPQDGHARLLRQGKQVDLRISVVPTVNGESVVIRILDKDAGLKPLDELGFRDDELDQIRRLISRPNGIFLVTGPTGSGKSTTLYAVLNEVKQHNPHILTVEDPVEYDMAGVEQVQIALAKGYTFAEALRHFLRHDPDVIMVGEIRDEETAHIANKAALTGHLVFSTLHTNDAASTVTRLLDMGIENYLLSTTLLGVMAQRLVRVNCPDCITEEQVEPHILKTLDIAPDEKFFHGAGCLKCHYTGYHGRAAVIELLRITPEISRLIIEGRPAKEITQLAMNQGMRTLQQCALDLARQGRTSLEEVYALYTE